MRTKIVADQGNEGLLSPYLRWRRMRAVLPYIRGRVLDVGCGSGVLAGFVSPERYLGIDLDEESLNRARLKFPIHFFTSRFPAPEEQDKFDVVAALAVIEHVTAPGDFLRILSLYLNHNPSSLLLLTTPHPLGEWIHGVGASLGLFSRHANEEHEELLDRKRLEIYAKYAGLNLVHYKRFLVGMNQLVILQKNV